MGLAQIVSKFFLVYETHIVFFLNRLFVCLFFKHEHGEQLFLPGWFVCSSVGPSRTPSLKRMFDDSYSSAMFDKKRFCIRYEIEINRSVARLVVRSALRLCAQRVKATSQSCAKLKDVCDPPSMSSEREYTQGIKVNSVPELEKKDSERERERERERE